MLDISCKQRNICSSTVTHKTLLQKKRLKSCAGYGFKMAKGGCVIRLIWLQACPSTFLTEFSFKELFYVLSVDISLRHIVKTHTLFTASNCCRAIEELSRLARCAQTTSKPFLRPLYNTTPSIHQLDEVIHLQAEFVLTIHSLELWRIPFRCVLGVIDFCEAVDSFVWDLQMSTFCRGKSLG